VRRIADVIDIDRAEAFLGGRDRTPRRDGTVLEVGFKGDHARHNKEESGVVRNERFGRQPECPLALKKL
jgi:hypothetical protein